MDESLPLPARITMGILDAFDKTALGLGVILAGYHMYYGNWVIAAKIVFLLVFVYGGLKLLFYRLQANSEA